MLILVEWNWTSRVPPIIDSTRKDAIFFGWGASIPVIRGTQNLINNFRQREVSQQEYNGRV